MRKTLEYIKCPSSIKEWEKIASEFENRWNFPNLLGALDGKHVMMFAPSHSGSSYFNYKKTHSIVLMAVCDAKYKFIMVDIGDSGRQSDGSVYNNGFLGYAIENNTLSIPNDKVLRQSDKVLPFVFVADDAFGLKRHMMKPYPSTNLSVDKLVFNYRLSRARRVVENAFGVAASRFRIFYRPVIGNVEKVKQITKAVVVLHNFLMTENHNNDKYDYCPPSMIDSDCRNGLVQGEWRKERQANTGLLPLERRTFSNNYSQDARKVRDCFKDYFNNEGAVEWQWEYVNRV